MTKVEVYDMDNPRRHLGSREWYRNKGKGKGAVILDGYSYNIIRKTGKKVYIWF